ncbi:hypothetical protein [Paraflavitalea speifideaquila]|uniref:hypothetical protein n=1 Tax=Paraflavitalea speifideaquila TaxID=3076558 RepID=UPI0028E9FCCC|nr:hypothetical protein [Paraflavitalea speifideiaquila]
MKKGIDPSEIDAMVVGTVTPDMLFPSTANLACHKLGLKTRGDLTCWRLAQGSFIHSQQGQHW